MKIWKNRNSKSRPWKEKILQDNWKLKEDQLKIEKWGQIEADLLIQKIIVNKDGLIDIIWNIK